MGTLLPQGSVSSFLGPIKFYNLHWFMLLQRITVHKEIFRMSLALKLYEREDD